MHEIQNQVTKSENAKKVCKAATSCNISQSRECTLGYMVRVSGLSPVMPQPRRPLVTAPSRLSPVIGGMRAALSLGTQAGAGPLGAGGTGESMYASFRRGEGVSASGERRVYAVSGRPGMALPMCIFLLVLFCNTCYTYSFNIFYCCNTMLLYLYRPRP